MFKSIKLFHCSTGKQFSDSKSTIIHHMEIKTISISQGNYKNQHNQRSLVFIDCQDDLYISLLLSSHEIAQGPSIQKLSKNVKSVAWNPSCDILVAIKDSQMITWYYPNAPFVDKDLLILASETKSIAQKGVFSQIKSFSCSIVHICNDNNGLSIELYVTPFAQIIRNLIASYQWKEAIQVCHLAKNDALWAMLAGLAMEHSDLNTLEIAIRATKQVDKLHYIQYIKGIKNQNVSNDALSPFFVFGVDYQTNKYVIVTHDVLPFFFSESCVVQPCFCSRNVQMRQYRFFCRLILHYFIMLLKHIFVCSNGIRH